MEPKPHDGKDTPISDIDSWPTIDLDKLAAEKYVAAKNRFLGVAEARGIVIPEKFKDNTDPSYVSQLWGQIVTLIKRGYDGEEIFEQLGITNEELTAISIANAVIEIRLIWDNHKEVEAIEKRNVLFGQLVAEEDLSDDERVDWISAANDYYKDSIGVLSMTEDTTAQLLEKVDELARAQNVLLNLAQEVANYIGENYGHPPHFETLVYAIASVAMFRIKKQSALEKTARLPHMRSELDASHTRGYLGLLGTARVLTKSIGISPEELEYIVTLAIRAQEE
jgi:hypothetical protein